MGRLVHVTFDAGSKPQGLFVPGDEVKVHVWHPLAPVWGNVVKSGFTSVFDETTYAQMLDDAVSRNLRIYLDQDHATAHAAWSMTHTPVPALGYYCSLQVNHEGKALRRVNLAGHTCADAVPMDAASMPEGLAGFFCKVTKLGRDELEHYQALSIDFNPFGEDAQGHPVGQVLNCVGATNGPHLAGAGPAGGQFNRTRYFDMSTKKRKVFALAKGDAAGEGEAETKDLSAEMAELASVLGMPEGSAPESIIGAALAVIKASKPEEPDGDEGYEGEGDAMAADPAMPGAMKYADSLPEGDKKYARTAALRFSRPRRAVGLFAKEVGSKATVKAVLAAVVGLKARAGADGDKLGRLESQVAELHAAAEKAAAEKAAAEKAAAEKLALAREAEIDSILKSAGPTNLGGDGRLSEARIAELKGKARQYNMTPDDVRAWLPAGGTMLTQGVPKPPPAAGGNMVGQDTAARIAGLRDQYQKDTGKRLRYDDAGSIVASFVRGNTEYSYAKAKEQADRLPPGAFLTGGK